MEGKTRMEVGATALPTIARTKGIRGEEELTRADTAWEELGTITTLLAVHTYHLISYANAAKYLVIISETVLETVTLFTIQASVKVSLRPTSGEASLRLRNSKRHAA